MKEPREFTIEAITKEVRASDDRLRRVSEQDLQLLVGLVLRIVSEFLTLRKSEIITLVTEQLKQRGWSRISIWMLKSVLALVIDILVDWLILSRDPLQKAKNWQAAGLPQLIMEGDLE